MSHRYNCSYINGTWYQRADGEAHQVYNPVDGTPVATVSLGTAEDAAHAVAAARDAFDSWSQTSSAERTRYLLAIRAGLEARGEELAQAITREVGTPIAFSRRAQVGLPIATFAIAAQLAQQCDAVEQIGHSQVVHESIGVVACITPWNYPLHQIAAKVAYALAAGCTVILKPSEEAPACAAMFAEIIHEAGLPPGVFNLVNGTGPAVGEALARHPDVDMISFTGSTAAGRRVGELAAATVKRTTLELGGKSAAILLADADLSQAIPGALRAAFVNAGQTCSAHSRLLVPRSLYGAVSAYVADAARAMIVGDPRDEQVQIGPLANARQHARVIDYINRGVAEGAVLLAGGADPIAGFEAGYFVRPTVFNNVTTEMTIAREEIFGPVLSVLQYEDVDDAVRIANDVPYGLGGGIWSRDTGAATALARRLRTGQVDINGAAFNPYAPFGGYGQSGNGRELGRFGLAEFCEVKSIQGLTADVS
jgi:aldehyde dehydrogenase (NAD+)